ncbi:hypothetical protein [Chryseobacterium sp.]|uniref:hypothetical protein n=1 Tax=Chryseobacterium sp. TaxID=1871047 RepID=UPI00388EDA61
MQDHPLEKVIEQPQYYAKLTGFTMLQEEDPLFMKSVKIREKIVITFPYSAICFNENLEWRRQ